MHEPYRTLLAVKLLLTLVWTSPATALAHQCGAGKVAFASPEAQEKSPGNDGSFVRWLAGPVSVLLTKEELEVASRLDSRDGQSTFRQWFWARRDSLPETVRNEFRETFYDRLKFVEKEFGDPRAGKVGWSTAPGTIYLLLGPPDGVGHVGAALVTASGVQDAVIWTYDRDPLGLGMGTLRIPFVASDRSLVVVGGPPSGRAPEELQKALHAAVVKGIHQPHLRFGSLLVAGNLPAELPATARVRRDQQDLYADLSFPLNQLYGRSAVGGLRIELRLDLVRIWPGAAAPQPSELHATASPGGFAFNRTAETMQQMSGRNLRIALWLPPTFTVAGGRPTHLVVREVPSGRQLVIALAEQGEDVPDHYAVEQVLGVGGWANGDGVAVAFVEVSGDSPPASLHLTRRPNDVPGGAELPLPGQGLHLVRHVVPGEGGSR